jgi:hypothetical protein
MPENKLRQMKRQRKHTCHQAGPGMVKRKKLRALQTMDRVLPGAIGMLKEHINISQFFSPTNGSFTGSSILQSHTRQCLRSSIQKYESTNQTTPTPHVTTSALKSAPNPHWILRVQS